MRTYWDDVIDRIDRLERRIKLALDMDDKRKRRTRVSEATPRKKRNPGGTTR